MLSPRSSFCDVNMEMNVEPTLSARELIILAIDGEKTSYALYSRASIMGTDLKVKRIFDRIAQDELGHLLTLIGKFEAVYPGLSAMVDIRIPSPDPTEVMRLAKIGESSQALECATREERESLQLYLQLMQFVKAKSAKIALKAIIQDEESHIRALDSLAKKQAWWVGQVAPQDKCFH